MSRREIMLVGAGVLLVGQAAITGAAAEEGTAKASPDLARAAAECVRAGEVCLQHCLDLLATGDKTLGACAQRVNQMLAVCRAVGPLALAGGKHLAAMARICRDVCTDCEAACREHEKHHAPCKACADVCAKVIVEAKRVAA
jgi:Cys-rich four helix bundle protein (predicted Tat secretion target)